MGEISVSFATETVLHHGTIAIEDDGVHLRFRHRKDGFYAWADVRRISFDDPGRDDAALRAVVAFGPLGLLNVPPRTLIIVSLTDQDLTFGSSFALAQWRASLPRMIEDVPAAAAKLYLGDRPAADASATEEETGPRQAGAIVDQIKSLGELHAAGVLTDEEFQTKKTELLARL